LINRRLFVRCNNIIHIYECGVLIDWTQPTVVGLFGVHTDIKYIYIIHTNTCKKKIRRHHRRMLWELTPRQPMACGCINDAPLPTAVPHTSVPYIILYVHVYTARLNILLLLLHVGAVDEYGIYIYILYTLFHSSSSIVICVYLYL